MNMCDAEQGKSVVFQVAYYNQPWLNCKRKIARYSSTGDHSRSMGLLGRKTSGDEENGVIINFECGGK
jgi:hypothetical protein